MKARLLVVDDEKNIRRMLSLILSGAGHAVREAASGEEALSLLDEQPADLLLLDVGLPGRNGIEILKSVASTHPGTVVIMISGQATIATAVEATRLGAFDFLEKPLSKDRVLIAVRNALQLSDLDRVVDGYRAGETARRTMIGASAVLEALRADIARAAPTAATILVTGESGTGKELVARLVHEMSPRRDGPFVKVNCAAIPEELIETELFGCVRGAYTGADRARDGKFLVADGGTLFLDEVGDMSVRVQAKVLRALQEREIERVGDHRTIRVDVRVVAATNKDLAREAGAGRFREDLFYRLNVVPLQVPALRERRDDIALLSRHFLGLYAAENDLPARELTDGALALLRGMEWRGNIRELRNVIERLAILSDGSRIGEADVLRLTGGVAASGASLAAGTGAGAGASVVTSMPVLTPDAIRAAGGLVQARREFERRCIEECLRSTKGNVSRAARWLGIERSNLHKKLQAYGLESGSSRFEGDGEDVEEEEEKTS